LYTNADGAVVIDCNQQTLARTEEIVGPAILLIVAGIVLIPAVASLTVMV
jgi:hypothetical protein